MSHTAIELLIIYHTEAQQWATYLESVFTGPISETGICCCDITAVSSQRDDVLRLAQYKCKLLILSKGMLDGLCQRQRFFLACVLRPAAHVVVLLCGVDSPTPLLEQVLINSHECLQISSEQEAHEYLSAVTDIVKKGAANVSPLPCKPSKPKVEQMQSPGFHSISCTTVVVPSRVSCGASVELFILLKDEAPGTDAEVEFTGENQTLTVKPIHWNERILCVNAPDFPAGNVTVNVYSNGVPLSKAQLQYYSSTDEMASLLVKVADPADFMCQALQVSSVDMLDEVLSSMLLKKMPTGGFSALQCENTPEEVVTSENHHTDVPSLLHFAAQYGFKSVSSLLLQCPGAERALHMTNRHGQSPAEIARRHGHTELHVLLKEKLNVFSCKKNNSDATVYAVMRSTGNPSTADGQKEQHEGEGEEVEDLYAPLGVNDEYDTIVNSTKAVVVIANRPPAPTPRPESINLKEDRTPYITQVFQKKIATPGNADLYSLPTKQAHRRHNSVGSAYDTFIPNQKHGHEQHGPVQQRVRERVSSLTVGDWQRVQRVTDAAHKERVSQLRASPISTISSSDNNECVYGSQPKETDFYSKPIKGQHSNFFKRADKR